MSSEPKPVSKDVLRKIAQTAAAAAPTPAPRQAIDAQPAEVRELSNGNAFVLLGGTPVGIYYNAERAAAGIGMLERLGIAERVTP